MTAAEKAALAGWDRGAWGPQPIPSSRHWIGWAVVSTKHGPWAFHPLYADAAEQCQDWNGFDEEDQCYVVKVNVTQRLPL